MTEELLSAVAKAAEAKASANTALVDAIREARVGGAGLAEIGGAAGLTKQRVGQIINQVLKEVKP